MKKIYFIIALLFAFLLYGCGDETPVQEARNKVIEPILDYYPDNIGSRWVYQNAEGNTLTRIIKKNVELNGIPYKMWQLDPFDPEVRTWQAKTLDSGENYLLFRKTSLGIRLHTKELDENIMELVKSTFKPFQGWMLFNFKVQSSIPEGLLVQLPLKSGLDWLVMSIRASGNLSGGKKMTITMRFTGHSSSRKIITVPAGTFECIRITYKYKGDAEITGEIPNSYTETMYSHWLAPDVGIVQIEDASGTYQLVEYDLTLQ